MAANAMSEVNGNEATEEQTGLEPKLYDTKEEAEAARPEDATKSLRVFEVFKEGYRVGFILARGYDSGLAQMARLEGFSVSLGRGGPMTKEKIASKLSEFTDEELAEMGLSRKKGKK